MTLEGVKKQINDGDSYMTNLYMRLKKEKNALNQGIPPGLVQSFGSPVHS